MNGLAEAEKVRAFLSHLAGVVPNAKDAMLMWRILRKQDALGEISKGDAKLFFTPKDANISIEQHDHVDH